MLFAVTIVSPLGANPQPPGPNALFSILLYLISGRYIIPSGLTSTSSNGIGASNTSAASLEKGWDDRPWNERVQSTCRVPSSRIISSSASPVVISFIGETSSMDADFALRGSFEGSVGFRT